MFRETGDLAACEWRQMRADAESVVDDLGEVEVDESAHRPHDRRVAAGAGADADLTPERREVLFEAARRVGESGRETPVDPEGRGSKRRQPELLAVFARRAVAERLDDGVPDRDDWNRSASAQPDGDAAG